MSGQTNLLHLYPRVILLDLRVNKLVREQYTTLKVKLRDLIPESVAKQDSVRYLLDRTLLRPRDAITFLNECIKAGEGKARINQTMIYQAEEAYSESRLTALADEWSTDYPNLGKLCLLFKKFPQKFKQSEIQDDFDARMLEFALSQPQDDIIFRIARDKIENNTGEPLTEYLKILYRTGLIGVKPETNYSVLWS